MSIGRSAWLVAMVGVQAAWFCVRSLFAGEPFDASIGWILAATLVSGALVAATPIACGLGGAIASLASRPRLALLAVALLGFAAGAISSELQPAPSLDEGFVLDAARSMARGGLDGLVAAYRQNEWLARRHPPLGPTLFGAGVAAGLDLHGLRLLSAALLGLTAALTTRIAQSLYGSPTDVRAGVAVATLPLLVRMGGLAMNELLLTAVATAAVLVALSLSRSAAPDRPGRDGVALGAAIGVAVLIKYTMSLLAPAAIGIALVHRRLINRRRSLAVACGIAGLVFAAWWFALRAIGAADAQIDWLTRYSLAGLGSSFGPWSAGEAIAAKLPSAIGLYHLPLLLVGLRAAWGKGFAGAGTLLVWIATISLPLLLTLPENRYFLPAFPAIAILLALGLDRLPDWRDDALLLALLLSLVTVAYYGSLEVRTPARFPW